MSAGDIAALAFWVLLACLYGYSWLKDHPIRHTRCVWAILCLFSLNIALYRLPGA